MGLVSNFLDGKGAFTVTIGGEQFSGEETRTGRAGGSGRDGIANAMGSRGGARSFTHLLNSGTQGSGNVRRALPVAFGRVANAVRFNHV